MKIGWYWNYLYVFVYLVNGARASGGNNLYTSFVLLSEISVEPLRATAHNTLFLFEKLVVETVSVSAS